MPADIALPAARKRGAIRPSLPVLATGAFFGHIVWPTVALGLARTRSAPIELPDPAPGDDSRFVSVVVPAYREVGTIGQLVKNLLHGEGSPVAEFVVVADDDEETAAVAREAGAVVVTGKGRGGKSGALNRGIAAAKNDVVVALDANAVISVEAVRRLAEHVRSGRLDLAGGVRTEEGSEGEGLYWRFENTTKAAEHTLGGCLCVVGEVIALRRSEFRPIPEWVKVDDMWLAVDFASRRLRVSVDTEVVATEPSAGPRVQFERRIRMVAAQIETLTRDPQPFLTPTPQMAMFHAHKTWRTTGGPVCQAALTAIAVANLRRSWIARGWLAANTFAVGDYLVSSLRDQDQGKLRNISAQALGMPPVVLGGALWRLGSRLLRGTSDGTWTKVAR